jgi:hypothetical protein
MKTHFIDINADGIWENDFDTFYDNRLNRIVKALNKLVIPQDTSSIELEVYEDIEEETQEV